MSAWQFAFVCSRVLGAWLATNLVGHVAMLGYSLTSFFQTIDAADRSQSAFQMSGVFGPSVLNLAALAVISILFWVYAGTFADYATAQVDDADANPRSVIEWERPLVFLVGVWFLADALPGLGGLVVNYGFHLSADSETPNPFWSHTDNLIAATEYGVKLLLGLLVMINAPRLARWSRGDLAARFAALRTAGVAKSPDDPAA